MAGLFDEDDLNLDDLLGSNQTESKKVPEKSPNKEKGESNRKPTKKKKIIPWYKIVFAVLIGACVVFGIFVGVGSWYNVYIRYPVQQSIDYTQSGMYALENYASVVHELGSIDETSYLPQELKYANSNPEVIAFMNKVAGTVSYDSDIVNAKNVFGNDMVDKNTLEVIQIKSPVVEGEEISTFYVDYSQIHFNKEKVKQFMKEDNLKLGDVDYQNKLVAIFCRYINSLNELPIKEVRRIPNISLQYQEGTEGEQIPYYVVLPEEDIFFDTELFSSEEFYDCLDRFSAVAGDQMGSEIIKKENFWGEYKAEIDKNRPVVTPEPTVEPTVFPETSHEAGVTSSPTPAPTATPVPTPTPTPYKSMSLMFSAYLSEEGVDTSSESKSTLKETEEFLEWESYSDEKKKTVERPPRYGYKNTIVRDWCGAYYWQHYIPVNSEEVDAVQPKLGDGTKENPANLDTPVVTQIIDDEGNFIPIKVTLKEFGVSKRAIDWFESKDVQNRGFNLNSGVQYCYMVFEVANLSDSELTIYDNSSLSDINANLSVRTGNMFGLQDSVTLQPDETGVIETWSRSTELYLKYLIWGSDFDRRAEPVWFRVLAGDLEDTSKYKMVHVEGSEEPEDGVEFNEDLDSYLDDNYNVSSSVEDTTSSILDSSTPEEGIVSSEPG